MLVALHCAARLVFFVFAVAHDSQLRALWRVMKPKQRHLRAMRVAAERNIVSGTIATREIGFMSEAGRAHRLLLREADGNLRRRRRACR